MTKRVLLFCFIFVASVLCAAQTTRRFITDQDLFRFVWIGDPQISPDGSEVAFVRVSVNKKRTGYDTELWKVSTDASGAPIRLTSGPHDGSPRWSPDGKTLAFVRGVKKEGKPEPAQLCLLPMNGGEAWTITSLPKGVHGEKWSPDGKTILFVSDTTPEDLAKAKRKAPAGDDEHESDVRVITRALYRDNDEGYIDFKRHSHVWTVAVPASPEEVKDPKQITSGEFDEDDPAWSADGSQIYFTSTRVNEPYYEPAFTVLYAVPAGGGEIKQIMRFEGGTHSFSLSPDGKQIAFAGALSQPVLSYTQPHLWIADLATGKATNIAPKLDSDVDSALIADQHPPRGGTGHHPQWSADGHSLIEVVAEKGTASLRRFDIASGTVTPITHGNQEVITFTATPSGKVVALVDNATEIGDLYSDCQRWLAQAANQRQPAIVERVEPNAAGRVLVHIVRWQENPGVDSEATRFRSGEEVPAHPRYSRRTACGLRLFVLPRVSLDGREGVRRALSQSARQHFVWAGLRKHHSVSLPG